MRVWNLLKQIFKAIKNALSTVSFATTYDYVVQSITVVNLIKAKVKGETLIVPKEWTNDEQNKAIVDALNVIGRKMQFIPEESKVSSLYSIVNLIADKLIGRSKEELVGVWHGIATGILSTIFPKVDVRVFSFLVPVIYGSIQGLRPEKS